MGLIVVIDPLVGVVGALTIGWGTIWLATQVPLDRYVHLGTVRGFGGLALSALGLGLLGWQHGTTWAAVLLVTGILSGVVRNRFSRGAAALRPTEP